MPASSTPIPSLYKTQIGTESTWGTAVTPTAQLGLVESLEIQAELEAENLKEQRASAAPYVAVLTGTKGTAKMKGTASYEDLPYWLDALMGLATPSGANPYVRAYLGMLGTVPSRRTYTITKGSSAPFSNIYGLAGSVLKKAAFTIETGKAMTYDLEFGGKIVEVDTFASLSDRTQTPILPQSFALYIDAWGGTIGTTAITTPWYKAELSIDTKADTHPGLGSLSPVGYHETPETWEVKLKMSLEIDATSKAMFDSIIGTSLLQKQIRIKATTGASAIAQFDVAGSFLSAPAFITDADGVSTLDFELTSLYNPTLGNHIAASVTNAVATLA